MTPLKFSPTGAHNPFGCPLIPILGYPRVRDALETGCEPVAAFVPHSRCDPGLKPFPTWRIVFLQTQSC